MLMLVWLVAPPVVARHVRELLRPDGTLNLTTGFSGSLDVSGFGMELDPARGPMFHALAPTAIGWSALGTGTDGNVYALAVIGSDLYVGGAFTTAGGVSANRVAKWDGTNWSALGTGVNGQVNALAVVGSDLYAGGVFSSAGGSPASNIAKWNGTNWSALGAGVSSAVNALAVIGSDLYVGGSFITAGSITVNRVAKWDGTSWSALGTGVDNTVWAFAVTGSDLYVGGNFTNAGGASANRVAKWDGTNWSALGTGVSQAASTVYSLAVLGGYLYAGGLFNSAGSVTAYGIARWNITTSVWSALGTGLGANNRAYSMLAVGSDLYVGGVFTTAGGVSASNIAKWNGTSWSALGTGLNSSASALAVIGSDLYVGGPFTTAGGNPASKIARYGDVTPLPVTLRYFNGRMTEAGALLGWATAREVNNASFHIERSQNAVGFESIGTIPSQAADGNSLTELTYTFTDAQPLPGTNYYRLMQTDRDGTRTQAGNIIALKREGVLPVLFPNPVSASGEASVEPALAYQRYQISDVLGRVVQRADAPGLMSRVSLAGLPAGVYLVQVETTDGGRRMFRVLR